VHYADPNDAEVTINGQLIDAIELLFGPDTRFSLNLAAIAFVDALVESRKLDRFEGPGLIFEIQDLQFPLSTLLTHLPLQRWPLPHPNQCPSSFCDEIVAPKQMEIHIETSRSEMFQRGLHYSEVHLPVAGLLEIRLDGARRIQWRYPFSNCESTFEWYMMISDHIFRHHTGIENELYRQMGSFWAAMICVINETEKWPWVHEIFATREERQIAFTTEPLDKESSDEVWRQGEKRISVRDLPARILPGSPL
jgi:hypothetical protein